jgi:hypothetical protein
MPAQLRSKVLWQPDRPQLDDGSTARLLELPHRLQEVMDELKQVTLLINEPKSRSYTHKNRRKRVANNIYEDSRKETADLLLKVRLAPIQARTVLIFPRILSESMPVFA